MAAVQRSGPRKRGFRNARILSAIRVATPQNRMLPLVSTDISRKHNGGEKNPSVH